MMWLPRSSDITPVGRNLFSGNFSSLSKHELIKVRPARRASEEENCDEILNAFYTLNGTAPTDEKLYQLIDFVESCLSEKRFRDSDLLLTKADVKRLHIDVLVACLCSTLAAKHMLSHRSEFVSGVLAELRMRQINEVEIRDILDGLE
jgi:hypothetical protein